LPDDGSGIFFARGLDRPGRIDFVRENRFLVQGATYHREFIEDEERMEYFVPIRWLHSEPLDQGVNEIGMFGNQNTV
jgi:hypothetical protein